MAPIDQSVTLPYAAWSAMSRLIAKWQVRGIPDRFPAGTSRAQTATQTSKLRTALRFLRLIDSSDRPTARLERLVSAHGSPRWAAELGKVLQAAYDPVLAGADPSSLKLRDLVRLFHARANVRGSMLRKAVRFYVSALGDTNIRMSPDLATRGLRALVEETEPSGPHALSAPPAARIAQHGGRVIDLPVPGVRNVLVVLPKGLTPEHWAFVDEYVRRYLTL